MAMDLSSPVLQIGSFRFTLLDVAFSAAGLGLLLLLIAVIMAFRAQAGRAAERDDAQRRTADMEYRLAELSGALQGFATQSQSNQIHLQRVIDERLDLVSSRVGHGLSEQTEKTTQSLLQLGERLAVIDAAQKNLTSLSSEMVSLKDILNNKQSRGAFGQGRMEAIIRDNLHAKAYAFQATLSNGTRPDCLISLPDSPVKLVIDAKFPLEAYSAFTEAKDEMLRKAAEQRFKGDVLKHVKDIAEKYLLAGETQDTAIMFVPSESIYAELHEKFEDVVQKAHRLRIIFASPNVLMLLVQTMQSIVKDVAMREQAHVIKAEVVRLLEDVTRLRERANDLRRHFDMANVDLEKLTTSADRISKRGVKIESLDVEPVGTAAVAEAPKPRLVQGG
ncbi:MAG: DNA recombination protein RmuC [Phyllobacteriaceae bacterium]|nr:DNA recombination protein RmuC [Phyllobacteriaceae bacterium]